MRSCDPLSISAEELSEILSQCHTKQEYPLIIDTRPFLVYRQSHIDTAVNLYVPPLLLRRLRKIPGKFNIEKLTNCQDIKQKLGRRMEVPVIVYTDKQSSRISPQILPTIIDTLIGDCKELYVLEDSFDDISNYFPSLIMHENSAVKSIADNRKPKSRSPRESRYIHGLGCQTVRCDGSVCSMQAEATRPAEIIPLLYLGNERDSSNLTLLRKLGVSKVINVSRDCANHFPEFFEYLNIPVEDRVYTDISQHFAKALQFIEHARGEGCSVLVHCRAGISRSATLIMAYLIQYHNKSLEEAFDFIKLKHPYISPNFNFMGQLLQFQNQHRQKSSDGSTPASETWEDDDQAIPLSSSHIFERSLPEQHHLGHILVESDELESRRGCINIVEAIQLQPVPLKHLPSPRVDDVNSPSKTSAFSFFDTGSGTT